MRIGKQSVAGLLTALMLFPMPALAIHSSLSKATAKVTVKAQPPASASTIIQHENEERLSYNSFSRDVRAQFRGQNGPGIQASVNQYLKNVLKELRLHWRAETRSGIASPFNFPTI